MLTYFIISGCPSIVPGASAGVIYSPDFPWWYPTNIVCEWFIAAPRGKKINLTFIKFRLQSGFGSCEYVDSVEVHNAEYGYLIGEYCGSQIPSSVTSSSSLRVRFTSDHFSTSSGFMAFYQTGYSFTTVAPTYYWTTNPYTYDDRTTKYRRLPNPSTAARIHACDYNSQTSKLSFSITVLI